MDEITKTANLIKLFELLEQCERKIKVPPNEERKYLRMLRGTVVIGQVHKRSLTLVRKNGTPFGTLHVNTRINSLLKPGDSLDITLGLRERRWRVITFLGVQSQLLFPQI